MKESKIKELANSIVDEIIAEKGMNTAIRKVKVNAKPAGEMDKYEKTAKYFQAKAFGDIATEKALAGGLADNGATLLPIEFVAEVIDRVKADAIALRSKVYVMPVNSATGTVPVATEGVTMEWALSDAAINSQDMKFGEITYAVNQLQGYTKISNNLLSDTPVNLFNVLAAQYAKTIVKYENAAIINGTGVAQPVGIANVASGITGSTSAVIGKISADEVVGLPFDVNVTWRSGASFVVPTALMKQIRLLKNLNDGYLFVAGDITKGVPATLCGYPVIELDTVGDNTSIIFGDLSQYILFDRQTMGTDINTQGDEAFKTNSTLVRYFERIDGKVAVPAAFTKLTLKA